MKGFFSTGETSSSNMPEGKILSCITCGLYKDCISARMKPYGNNKKNILVCGEAPGEWEDLQLQTGKTTGRRKTAQ